MRRQLLPPCLQQRRAERPARQAPLLRMAAPGGGAQQAQAEDRAAMRIDAAGGGQHSLLGFDTIPPQACKRCAVDACLRHADEVAAQRKQTAHEGQRIHVVVAAAVDQRNQPRFRIENELRMQAAYRKPADAQAGFAFVRIGIRHGSWRTLMASGSLPAQLGRAHGYSLSAVASASTGTRLTASRLLTSTRAPSADGMARPNGKTISPSSGSTVSQDVNSASPSCNCMAVAG